MGALGSPAADAVLNPLDSRRDTGGPLADERAAVTPRLGQPGRDVAELGRKILVNEDQVHRSAGLIGPLELSHRCGCELAPGPVRWQTPITG
jgi:hypothetical protein